MARIEEQNFVNAWLTEPHEEQEDTELQKREDRCVRNENHHLTQDSFA